jgi:hypothetical protein
MKEPSRKAASHIEVKLCPHCHFPNKPKDTYCKYCETPLIDANPGLMQAIKNFFEERQKLLTGNLSILLGLLLVAMAVYLLFKGSPIAP